MPFLAQQFEEHLKNTLVLFVHMTSYLQLLFDPTRTLCGITSKFTLSRAWDTTVIYLLTLQFKGEILWKTKFKLIVHSWFKDEYRQATGILLERLTIDFLSTKPHTHMYVVLLPLNSPSTPPPPLGSITRPVDCRYVVCLIVRANWRRQGNQFNKHCRFCVGRLLRANQSIKSLK